MKKQLMVFTAVAAMAATLTVTSCKKDVVDPSMASAGLAGTNYDLYNRLGGTAIVADPANPGQMIEQGRLTLRSVVDSTIFVIAGDAEFLTTFFPVLVAELGAGNTSGLSALSASLTDFFCVATGSKNHIYAGMNMKDAHNPAMNPRMGATSTNADYNKFIGFVVEGAGQNGVPADHPIVADLGKLLESLRTTIVQN